MKVEREIAGFTIPYAAGAFIAAYAGNILCVRHISCASASLTFTMILLVVLVCSARHHLPEPGIRWTIALLGMAAGLFCGFNQAVMSISELPSGLAAAAEGFGESMQAAVDSLPFRDARTSAVIKALTTGERSSLGKDVVQVFRDSGASHILALSGLHLGIIYGIVSHSLSIAGNSIRARYARSALTVILCGSYTLATGAGASIVRAFLFILLNEAGRLTFRCHSGRTVFFAALLIQLCLSPQSAGSVSFQLSYAAMAGISFIYPMLRDLWPQGNAPSRLNPMKRIWESCALSISCQLTTGPLAYMYFGTFPMHFLLTNLLALPIVGIVVPLSLATLVLHCIGICPHILIFLTEGAAGILIRTLEIIASM